MEQKKEWSVEDYQEVVYIYNYHIYNGELFPIDCNWEETTNPYLKTCMSKYLLQASQTYGQLTSDNPYIKIKYIPEVEYKHKTVHEKEFLSTKGVD